MDDKLFGSGQLDGASDDPPSGDPYPGVFPGLSELESHLENHKEARPFKCNLCDRTYRHAGSLVNHKKTHQVGLYACLICQKEYSNPMGLKNHLRTHSEERRFNCGECGESFRMARQLSSHRKASHGFYSAAGGEELPGGHEGFDASAPALMENGSLISNLENYIAESMVAGDFSQLVSKYYPEERREEKMGGKPEIKAESQVEESEEQVADGSVEERRYKCKQCGKAYKHAGSLANHKQSHSVGVYQCAICYKEFTNLMAMKNHCRLHSHSRSKKRFSATFPNTQLPGHLPEVPETLLHAASTHGHLAETHDERQPVSESSVSEEETWINPLLETQSVKDVPPELASPTKTEESFAAISLNAGFQVPKEDDLMQETPETRSFHPEPAGQSQTEHSGSEEEARAGESPENNRPFKCQECGRTYRHAGSLINHKKTHQTGVYNCSVCAKQLFNMAALKNHLRAHFKSRTGRRPDDAYFHSAGFSDELFQAAEDSYRCVACHEFFASEADLLQHQTLHGNAAGCEKQRAEGLSAQDDGWGENPQGSQGSSEDSAYSSGQGIPEAIKREVESLALHPPFHQWSQESSPDNGPVDAKPAEDPGTPFQNHFTSCNQSPENKINPKERDPCEPEERDPPSADDRPHKCEACGKTYRHKSSLLNHKLTHKTGNYPCSLCPKQYPNLMALRNHLRFHSRSLAGRRGALSTRSRQLYGEPKALQSGAYPSASAAPRQSPKRETTAVSAEGSELFDARSEVAPAESSGPETLTAIKSEVHFSDSQIDVCEAKEADGRGAQDHEHPEKKAYECDLCEKAYRHSGSLINHKRTHQTGDYACSVCSKRVANLAALKNHLRIHHRVKKEKLGDGNESSGFLAPDAYFPREEVFQSEEDLLAAHVGLPEGPWGHMIEDVKVERGLEAAGGSSDLEQTSDADADRSLDSSEDQICPPAYRCHECGEVFSSSAGLRNHKHAHQTGIYQCSFCPKEYPNLSALRSHFQTHTKPHRDAFSGSDDHYLEEDQLAVDHRYDCGHCGMIFCSEADFHQHQVAHENQAMSETSSALHTEDGVPGCPFPMQASETELVVQMKGEAEEEGPREAAYGASHLSHICGFCGQTYDDLESLEAHSLSHSDENLPPASDCQAAPEAADFQNTDLLRSHELKDDAASGDPPSGEKSPERRPYTCDQCGKSYRHGGSLVNHKKTHLVGNFQCFACFRQYPNLAAYRNHLRHQPKCKQLVTPNSLHELHLLGPADTTYPAGNRDPLSCPLPAGDPLPGLYDASKPTADPALPYYSADPPQDHRLTASLKRPRAKSPRKAVKRRRPRINPSFEDQSPSTDPQNESSLDDKSTQTCECCGTKCNSIDELVIHLASGCAGSGREATMPSPARDGGVDRLPDSPAYKIVLNAKKEAEEPGFLQRPFRCEVCGRSYRHAGSLINHKQTHKTGVFRCSICQKRFFNLMAMKNHNRIHFGLRRHKCLDCGKAFRLQKQLDTHQRIHRESPPVRKPRRRNRRGAKSHVAGLLQQHQKPSPADKSPKGSPAEDADGAGGSAAASPGVSKKSASKRALNPDSRPYQCEECGRSYRHAGSLINHKKSHKMGQYCCTTCGKTYPNLMAMKNHQRTHYETKKFHCLECGKAFKWIRQLVRHQHVHARRAKFSSYITGASHLSDPGEAADAPQDQERVPLSSSSQAVAGSANASMDQRPPVPLGPACQDCGVLFVGYNELENHKCGQNRVDESSGPPADGHGSTQTQRAEERPYRCNLCARTYRHAGSLINHKNTHKSGEYKCSICSKQFSNPISIRHHLRTHTAEKRFQCLRCGKAFSSSVKLMCHHRVHTGERPFQCPTCHRGFSSKLTLRHHQRTHREPASLSAPPASSSPELPGAAATKSGASIPSEEGANHADTKEERRFKCDQCDKSYRHAASLLNHRKTHNTGVYHCPDCQKPFYNLLALKNHLRTHRYQCRDCGKAFRTSGHLAAHRKIHEERGQFACPICSKHFFSRSGLEQHRLSHGDPRTGAVDSNPVATFMVKVS
ncbi:zinc finger protein 646 [Spea bombifrons]|uniref:zinc finger protein 646 n=1 Tax=Spea bombifrons TaxID=233779 RepID=UPI00234B9EC5|nr:zinc finger protein 646 [Spea bombifrons]